MGTLLGSIFILQTFDSIFMITQGGPGQATTNLPYFLYLQAFRRFTPGPRAAAVRARQPEWRRAVDTALHWANGGKRR